MLIESSAMIRKWLESFFVDRRSKILFLLMFGIVCLLNVNYNILRSARSALVVADLGHGAASIPFFELCGTMPGAVLMVYLLTRLLNRFSIHKVFIITLATFSGFFLFFAVALYPSLPTWEAKLLQSTWLPGNGFFAIVLPQLCSMLFFVMAELWKIALLTVLFWGLVNQYIPMHDAKKFYAPLMLGGSVGTILAGPLVKFCTSDLISNHSWAQSLSLMMLSLSLLGALTAWFYSKLWKEFAGPKQDTAEKPKETLSVWESLQVCLKSRYLTLLAWITIADYVAYSLGEVIFLDVLKKKFPDPRVYCDYMGQLSFWSGLLTAISALVITPYLLRKCRWVVASLVTPVCILVTEGAFFLALWTPSISSQLELLVIFGTLFFCLVRAAKYTLFDTSKEISFLLLPPLEKMQGKLIIDGMCSRIGRGGASMLSITLIQLCGGVLASASIVGVLVLGIAVSCVMSTFKLGTLVDKKSEIKNPGAL
jgi:AAA family ATP:ADP antiporter